ncbi:MAG: tetratricopeptide repeat protein [Roseburia sp.]|nr:tetratricopeptide repeat protein [Roseburia sp.]MCM1097126.1 tetratricopeptide repeat protein [Ruminococcus flavefaciens]
MHRKKDRMRFGRFAEACGWYRLMAGIAAFALAGALTGCGAEGEKLAGAAQRIQALDYQGALEELEAAEEAGENQRLIDRSRGIAYMGLTEYDRAVECFLESLAGSNGFLQEVDFDTNYYLAAAYTKNGQFGEAESTYDAILDLRPEETEAYFLRGNVRMSLGSEEEALTDFDRAISMEPKNYDRLIRIYEVLADFGYSADGRDYLETALASGDKGMDAYVTGRIYYCLGEYQKAYLALEEAREKGGAESYLYLGRSYEATGDYNYAVSVYNSYLGKYDGNAEIYNQLGLCEMTRGEYQKALEAFQAGMKLENSGILQSLSFNEIVAYEHLGNYEQAYVLLGNYLKNYPDDEEARREYDFLSTR